MLNKLQRPKWQHKDPEVRQQAIAALDLEKEEDLSILSHLAQKDDAEQVRTSAIKLLRDMQLLVDIVQTKSSQPEKATAAEQIRSLLAKPLSTNGKPVKSNTNLLQTIFDLNERQLSPKEIAKIALESDAGLFAFERISEREDFLDLVQSAKQVKVKLAAIEKIDSADDLKTLQKTVSEKTVLQIIRDKLKKHKAAEDQQAQRLADAEKICTTIEKLAPLAFDERYVKRLQKQIEAWQDLDEKTRQPLQTRFKLAEESCKDTIAKYESEKKAQQEISEAKKVHSDVSKQAQILLSSFSEKADAYNESATSQKLEDLTQRWQAAAQLSAPSEEDAKRYYKTVDAIVAYRQFRVEYSALEAQLQQQLDSALELEVETPSYAQANAAVKTLKQLKQTAKWPKNFDQPELLNKLDKNLSAWQDKLNGVIKQNKSKTDQLHKKITVLQKEIQKKNLISANRLYNYVSKQIEELDPHYLQKESARLSRVDESLNELRDWHQFATEPKKEALCEKIEALLLESEQEPMERAEQIKLLQAEWKQLNSSNSDVDQALWERFKVASDKAFEPCLAYYAEQDALRAENLKKRMAICDRLESFLQSTDWSNVDWKKVEQLEKKAHSEWALYKSVPNKEIKSIQKRYDASIKQIREKLDVERGNNLEARKALIEQAIALSEQEDQSQTIDQAMALQKQWKSVGITYFRQDQKQWKKFRAACNKVFERRDAEREANKEKLQGDINKVQEILARLPEYLQLNDDELVKQKQSLADLKQEFHSLIRSVPIKQSKALKSNFSDINKKIDRQLAGVAGRKVSNRYTLLEALVALCEKQTQGDNPENVQAEFDQKFEGLPKKFQQAIKPRIAASKDYNALSDAQKEQDKNQKFNARKQIALELEVLLDIASPDEFKADRMAFQLEQLQQGLQARLDEDERRAKIQSLLLAWIVTGPTPAASLAAETARYEAIKKAAFAR